MVLAFSVSSVLFWLTCLLSIRADSLSGSTQLRNPRRFVNSWARQPRQQASRSASSHRSQRNRRRQPNKRDEARPIACGGRRLRRGRSGASPRSQLSKQASFSTQRSRKGGAEDAERKDFGASRGVRSGSARSVVLYARRVEDPDEPGSHALERHTERNSRNDRAGRSTLLRIAEQGSQRRRCYFHVLSTFCSPYSPVLNCSTYSSADRTRLAPPVIGSRSHRSKRVPGQPRNPVRLPRFQPPPRCDLTRYRVQTTQNAWASASSNRTRNGLGDRLTCPGTATRFRALSRPPGAGRRFAGIGACGAALGKPPRAQAASHFPPRAGSPRPGGNTC